jgi:hypothetical protein
LGSKKKAALNVGNNSAKKAQRRDVKFVFVMGYFKPLEQTQVLTSGSARPNL